MNQSSQWRLLPHELFFGLFLVEMWARLASTSGLFDGDALIYSLLIIVNVALICWCRGDGANRRWRVTLVFYAVAMNVAFAGMKTAIPKIHPHSADAALHHLDSLLVGTNLSLRLQPLVRPLLTDLLSGCYLLFFPFLAISMIAQLRTHMSVLKRFLVGLFTVYGIGFIGYSFVPAAGPGKYLAGAFTVPLDGGYLTVLNELVVAVGSNGADVFPSLHCAVSCFLLFFARRHSPVVFRVALIPCVGLWISTIYLRYHYAVDVVCGFALAALGLWLARRTSSAADGKACLFTTPAFCPAAENYQQHHVHT